MANDSVTGFFSLPRELRDEIYRYILVFQPPASKYTPTDNPESCGTWDSSPYTTDFQSHRHNLSLLRVCRRVHAETLPVFYGDNVFTIFVYFKRLSLIASAYMIESTTSNSHLGGLRVPHYAPWEKLGYIYPVENRTDQCRKYQPLWGPQLIGTPFQTTETLNSIATAFPPNGHLIRRLRIHCKIVDPLLLPSLNEPEDSGFGKHVLSHLAARIQAGTPNAFKEITARVGSDVWGPFDYDASMVYRSMINLVWPLTATGGYRITIMTSTGFMEPSHPGEDELLTKCRIDAQDEKEEDFVNIPVEEGSHWAIAEGRLIVQADEALFESD